MSKRNDHNQKKSKNKTQQKQKQKTTGFVCREELSTNKSTIQNK